MHQHTTQLVMANAAFLVAPAAHRIREHDTVRAFALGDKFRRVLDRQNRASRPSETIALGGEMAAQNLTFVKALVGEKSIRRLRACPVLQA